MKQPDKPRRTQRNRLQFKRPPGVEYHEPELIVEEEISYVYINGTEIVKLEALDSGRIKVTVCDKWGMPMSSESPFITKLVKS